MPELTLEDLRAEANWMELRSTALPPQMVSDLVTSERDRGEFIRGAAFLRLGIPGRPVRAHQLLMVDMLAAGHEENAAIMSRRSAKTTTAVAIALGRCAERPGYEAALTLATTAAKTSERMRVDVHAPIDAISKDGAGLGVILRRSNGGEGVLFENGARFMAASPTGSAFRSGGYDFVIVDESGEATPEQGRELSDAILPTFDTREGQVLYAGTAGVYRDGLLLWDALQSAPGRLAWWVNQDLTPDELTDWAYVEGLVRATHPGLASGLTSMEKIRARFDRLGSDRFAREYLQLFGMSGGTRGVIDPAAWKDAGQDGEPAVPEHFTFAVACDIAQQSTSIVAAWRDDADRACLYQLQEGRGTTWVAEAAARLSALHREPIVYDSASSPMRVEVEAMERMTPRPQLAPQRWGDVQASAALIVKEINTGRARHWRQPSLDEAAEKVVRRDVGPAAWALGRPKGDATATIAPFEAAALALHFYDDNQRAESFAPIVAS